MNTPATPPDAQAAADILARLAAVIESRKPAHGGDPEKATSHACCTRGPTLFEKIGEEATEVVMAAKDVQHGAERAKIVYEVADLWFHCLIALAHFGLTPDAVLAELARREGLSGIAEKAARPA